MKPSTPRVFLLFAASLILAACGNAALQTPSTYPSASPSPLVATISSTPIWTTAPAPTFTPTPISCDPLAVDFCISPAYFIFQRPILPPGMDSIDRTYPYASTAGGTRIPHHGVEFYNPSGTPVRAAEDGWVVYSGDDTVRIFSPWPGFYGNIVVLEHTLSGAPFEKLYTLYAHLSKLDISTGEHVSAGEVIGEVGLTGTASGSHLHFEVRSDAYNYDSCLNPELWLVPHPGNGSLALSAADRSGSLIFPSFNVQYYRDQDQAATRSYQVDAYAPGMIFPDDPWNENAAIGDIPAGRYRVTFIWAGVLYERWIEIQPGILTRISLQVE